VQAGGGATEVQLLGDGDEVRQKPQVQRGKHRSTVVEDLRDNH
jgi:hypothetical protein